MSTYSNSLASSYVCSYNVNPTILSFHEQLPEYAQTPLHSLPDLAKELGVSHVLVKDESNRFGLPSFKVLGASWGIYRALLKELGLPLPEGAANMLSLKALGEKANAAGIKLVSATDGNWGRAVARIGKYLDIPVRVHVPKNMDEATREKVAAENAEVLVVNGTYDDAIEAARLNGEQKGWLMVADHSWTGYDDIPNWVVDGYSTCLTETAEQVAKATDGKSATHAICGVGVGSWAQSLVQHYKSDQAKEPRAVIITVEAEAAPCVNTSLKKGEITTVQTDDTIMCGFNCGTPSETAWPYLKGGVDVSVLANDAAAHDATKYINKHGINGGPCGAATLVALRKLAEEGKDRAGLNEQSIIVLFCTERARDYVVPN